MTKLLIFDKDGVILDLEATWLPVARAVAASSCREGHAILPEGCFVPSHCNIQGGDVHNLPLR